MIAVCYKCRLDEIPYDVCNDGYIYRCAECGVDFYIRVQREVVYIEDDEK
jgi:hypothetical protein